MHTIYGGLKISEIFKDIWKFQKTWFTILLLLVTTLTGWLVLDNLIDDSGVSAAGSPIIVDAKGHGNFTTIQAAIDNATPGDTIYVWAGEYNEEIIVNKTITLIGNGTGNTTIKGYGNKNVILVEADWVNISGFKTNNSGGEPIFTRYAGIRLHFADHCNISDNYCMDNENGIYLKSSNFNTIQNNNCSFNDYAGIGINGYPTILDKSDNNIVKNNTCNFNNYGITSYSSELNKICNNACYSNNDYGMYLFLANKYKIENNDCTNNPCGIEISSSDWSYMGNNTCNYGMFGINITWLSDYNTFFNNSCLINDRYGIQIQSSSNNTFIANNFTYNIWGGAYHWKSFDNIFINNTCSKNQNIGFYSFRSSNITLINNSCLNNWDIGIYSFYSSNSTFNNNNISSNRVNIYLYYSNNNTISKNICLNSGYGIATEISSFNNIYNNTCMLNENGIYIYGDYWESPTLNNSVINNNCNYNVVAGIYLVMPYWNNVENNSCSYNTYEGLVFTGDTGNFPGRYNFIKNNTCNYNGNNGMYLGEIENNNIFNNICNNNSNSGIYLDGDPWATMSPYNNIIKNTCNNNQHSGIYISYTYHNHFENNTCNSNGFYGIAIQGSTFLKVLNNSCFYNYDGIYLTSQAYYNIVDNNNCSNNNNFGIHLEDWSSYCKIRNNSCISNNNNGIEIEYSHRLIVKNNTCRSSAGHGIYIYYSFYNFIENNTCYSNSRHGLSLASVILSDVFNNSCNSNSLDGIYLTDCSVVYFNNNTCNLNNLSGFNLYYANWNTISNSTCIENKNVGIYLYESSWNDINNNTCSGNNDGILIMDQSTFNKIHNNSFSNNFNGTNFIYYSDSNNFFNNLVSGNSNYGIKIDASSDNNYLFYNVIQYNTHQAIDSGDNHWNNTHHEGNYWSDYQGLDNGYNDRIAGDGIGDTLIPHLGLDYYPFIKPYSWKILKPPTFTDPGYIDYDGVYNLTWSLHTQVDEFIVEEAENKNFKSSTVIYQGSESQIKITKEEDGLFYYRVRAHNNNDFSAWSNIVDIIIDLPPEPPKNLQVAAWPGGNALNISWEKNLLEEEYIELYVKTIGDWTHLATISNLNNTYNHTNLTDGIRYYYKIRAVDTLNRTSDFSGQKSGIPTDSVAPNPPSNLNITNITYESITLEWLPPIDIDVEGFNLYRATKSEPEAWGEPINGNKLVKGHIHIDTGLIEGTKYFYVITAVDEVPNESIYSNEVSGTTFLFIEYPQPPKIKEPLSDFSIPEDSYDDSSINLHQWFEDVNGDTLVFSCRGQMHINVTIYQNNGTVILTPETNWNGFEKLTFKVTDGLFDVYANVTITITPVNDPPGTPEIINPDDGVKIKTGEVLTFQAKCSDPDLPYGDVLRFTWSSSKSGDFGGGELLKNIKLSKGNHQITLVVTDLLNLTSQATVNVTVVDSEKDQSQGLFGLNQNTILAVGIVILIIVIVILLLLFLRYKKKAAQEQGKTKKSDKPGISGKAKPLADIYGLEKSIEELEAEEDLLSMEE